MALPPAPEGFSWDYQPNTGNPYLKSKEPWREIKTGAMGASVQTVPQPPGPGGYPIPTLPMATGGGGASRGAGMGAGPGTGTGSRTGTVPGSTAGAGGDLSMPSATQPSGGGAGGGLSLGGMSVGGGIADPTQPTAQSAQPSVSAAAMEGLQQAGEPPAPVLQAGPTTLRDIGNRLLPALNGLLRVMVY